MNAYPAAPGIKASPTSAEAAASVAGEAARLRGLVLEAIRRAGEAGLTADEAAGRLDLSPFSTRPRCTELRTRKLIIDSGRRRRNASQRQAIVWVAL